MHGAEVYINRSISLQIDGRGIYTFAWTKQRVKRLGPRVSFSPTPQNPLPNRQSSHGRLFIPSPATGRAGRFPTGRTAHGPPGPYIRLGRFFLILPGGQRDNGTIFHRHRRLYLLRPYRTFGRRRRSRPTTSRRIDNRRARVRLLIKTHEPSPPPQSGMGVYTRDIGVCVCVWPGSLF